MNYDRNFEKYYENLLIQCSIFIENKRREAKRAKFIYQLLYLLFLIFGGSFICLYIVKIRDTSGFVMDKTPLLVFVYIVVAMFLKFIQVNNQKKDDYEDEFKKKIIVSLLSIIDDSIIYDSKKGLDSSIYREAQFGTFIEYKSEDLILGKLKNDDNFSMCEVEIKNINITKKEVENDYINFCGLFACVECSKNFNNSLYIRLNSDVISGMLDYFFNQDMKIELDSVEFEREFDVYSSDKIVALQLLTSDVMQLKKEMNLKYEITIKNNHIYYRFFCGKLFETNDLNKYSLDKKMLYKYYKIIKFSLVLSEKLVELVKDTEY